MSWQTYVDDHLMVGLPGGGMLTYAAIFGQVRARDLASVARERCTRGARAAENTLTVCSPECAAVALCEGRSGYVQL